MSCCSSKDTAYLENSAAISDARERLGNALSGTCNAVFYTPRQNNDCITPQQGCAQAHDCDPIPVTPLCPREYRLCVDQNGCATRYPADCRNLFWPDFSHPRWLPCNCLYCTRRCCTRSGRR